MNNESSQNENPSPDVDESRLNALLRGIDVDAAAPDVARLAAARERLLEEVTKHLPTGESPSPRKSVSLFRGLAAVAATAAAIWVGFNLFSLNSVQGAPFSKILANLRNAKSLEL